MAPKIDAMDALTALAAQEGQGPLTERGEFVMDRAMSTVVKALSAEIGGLGARSKVVRRLILKGARTELAERQSRAQPSAELDPAEAVREEERAKRRKRDRDRKERLAAEAPQA